MRVTDAGVVSEEGHMAKGVRVWLRTYYMVLVIAISWLVSLVIAKQPWPIDLLMSIAIIGGVGFVVHFIHHVDDDGGDE